MAITISTMAEPQMWMILAFSVAEAADIIAASRESQLTGQVTLHFKLGTIMSVEMKARPNDPGFRKLTNGHNPTG